jgi:hypothetical protein
MVPSGKANRAATSNLSGVDVSTLIGMKSSVLRRVIRTRVSAFMRPARHVNIRSNHLMLGLCLPTRSNPRNLILARFVLVELIFDLTREVVVVDGHRWKFDILQPNLRVYLVSL